MPTVHTTMALTIALTIAPPAWAASSEDKCEASKNQEAGRYAACLLKAEKGLVLGADTACGDLGLAYDKATRTYAGSDGSDANCNAVLDALAFSDNGLQNNGPGGDGCAYCESCFPNRLRETFVPTNPLSGDPLIERMCACH